MSVAVCAGNNDQTDDAVVDCPLCVSFGMVSTLNCIPSQVQCFVSQSCFSFLVERNLTWPRFLPIVVLALVFNLSNLLGFTYVPFAVPILFFSLLSDTPIATHRNDGPTELSAETFLASILVVLVARWLAAWLKTVSVECLDSFLLTFKAFRHACHTNALTH